MTPQGTVSSSWAIPLGVMIVAFVAKLSLLGNYPVLNDELISLEAVRGIAEHGVPWLENGRLYWRSLVSHYLLAIPTLLGADGINPGRAVSLLFNALTAGLVWRIARTLEKHAVPATLATVAFLLSSLVNLNTFLMRDYAIFTFFAVAVAYSVQRHFIDGASAHFRYLLILSPLLAGAHDLAAGVLPLLGAGAVYAVCREPGFLARSGGRLAGLFLLAGASAAFFIWFRPAVAQQPGLAVEMTLGGMKDKWFLLRELRDYAPYALVLFLPGLLFGVFGRQKHYLYWGLVIAWLGAFLTVVSPLANSRYFMPVVTLVIVFGVCTAWRVGAWLLPAGLPRRGLAIVAITLVLIGVTLALSQVGVGRLLGFSYTYLDAAPVHRFVAAEMPANALLLSMQPGLTEYHMNRRPDFFLRQKVEVPGQAWTTFGAEDKVFSNYQTLDSVTGLAELRTRAEAQGRPVCLVVDYLFDYTLSPALRYYIQGNFELVYKDDQFFAVFLSKADPR